MSELRCPDPSLSGEGVQFALFVREGVLRSHLAFKGGCRDTLLYSLLPGELR
jgi:RimJ/RimL family protein N-acetyltransferase